MGKDDFKPFNTPNLYRDWSRVLDRVWGYALSDAEYRVARFIFDRTAGWAKEWERIPMHHFTEGIFGPDGTSYGGLGYSASKVKRTTRSLINKGVVLREGPTGTVQKYSINYRWSPSKMKVPKRIKLAQELDGSGVKDDLRVGSGATSGVGSDLTPVREEEKKKEEDFKSCENPSGIDATSGEGRTEREELEQGIADAASRSKARREAKKSKGREVRAKGGLVPTADALRKIWVDLHSKHFPNKPCSPLPDKSVHMLRSYAKEFNKRLPAYEWTDFLEWLFQHWTVMVSTSLGWMSSRPDCPTPGLVAGAKMRCYLEDAWGKREMLEKLYALSPRERDIQFIMLDRTVPREVAEKMSSVRKDATDAMQGVKKQQRLLDVDRESFRREQAASALRNKPKPDKIVVTEEEEAEMVEGIHRSRARGRDDRRVKKRPRTSPEPTVSEEDMTIPEWE